MALGGARMSFVAYAFIAVAAASIGEPEYESLWTQYKADFTKEYAAEEQDSRFTIFKENVDFIAAHNAQAAEHGFTVGINQFADMTKAEFKKTMLTYQAERKVQSNVIELNTTNLADSVDWVAKGAVTHVKNQGQCGSCWAFSATGSIEGAYQIATGQLLSFSEQELIDCAGSYGNQGCNGGLMDNGFEYIKVKGDALESTYSYTGKYATCATSNQSQTAIKPGVVTSINNVRPDDAAQLMAAVAKGPVSVAIEADQSGFQFYKSGIFSGICNTDLDHGVLVVGYGTDSGQDYWKVKNSWGTTWGDDGYIMLARKGSTTDTASRKLLGGGGASGKCGLLKQPSYPVVSKSVQVNLV